MCRLLKRGDVWQSSGQTWWLLSHQRQVRAHSKIQESCTKSNLCSIKVELGLLNRVQAGKTGPSLEKGLSHHPAPCCTLCFWLSCWSVMWLDWGSKDTQGKREMCLWTLDDSGLAGSWTEVFWISILNSGSFIPPCSHGGHLRPLMSLALVLHQGTALIALACLRGMLRHWTQSQDRVRASDALISSSRS